MLLDSSQEGAWEETGYWMNLGGRIFRSFSLNRTTIRLKWSKNSTQPNLPSLPSIFSGRLVAIVRSMCWENQKSWSIKQPIILPWRISCFRWSSHVWSHNPSENQYETDKMIYFNRFAQKEYCKHAAENGDGIVDQAGFDWTDFFYWILPEQPRNKRCRDTYIQKYRPGLPWW